MRPLLFTLATAALVTAVVAYGPELPFRDDADASAPGAEGDTAPAEEPASAPGGVVSGSGDGESVLGEAPAPGLAGQVGEAPLEAAPPETAPPADGVAYVRGTVRSSVYAALADALPHEVAEPLTQVVNRALVWWIDPTRDLRPGDEVEVLYGLPEGEEPVVHAVRFRSAKYSRTFQAFAFRPEGSEWARLYDETGRELEKRLVDGPIESYEQITSLVNDGRRHQGVDFKGPVGTQVLAPFDGRVLRRNWNTRVNGYCLDIEGPGGVNAIFLHLDGIEDSVRPGTRIRKGQPIARLGNTGRSTAPHLHYQLQRGRKVLDPFRHHETRRRTLEEAQRAGFERERDRLSDRLDREKGRTDEA